MATIFGDYYCLGPRRIPERSRLVCFLLDSAGTMSLNVLLPGPQSPSVGKHTARRSDAWLSGDTTTVIIHARTTAVRLHPSHITWHLSTQQLRNRPNGIAASCSPQTNQEHPLCRPPASTHASVPRLDFRPISGATVVPPVST